MPSFRGMRPARSPAELGLAAYDRRRLERALKQARDARHFRRLLAVKLIAEGKGPGEVARISGMSRHAVYFWLERYRKVRTPRALQDMPRSGRPRQAPHLTRGRLARLVRKKPWRAGYATDGWTVALLAAHLKRTEGIEVSPRSLRRRLHEANLRWKRPRYVYATRAPHLAQKKGALSAV